MSRFGRLLQALHERHPWDEDFAAEIEANVRKRCEAVPVHVHKLDTAELALEQACREAIVECYLKEYEEAWFPITVRRNWPIADAIIEGEEALVRFSISPEIDALLGGNQRPRLRIKIKPAPPNIYERVGKGIGALLRREPKTRPELELNTRATAAPPPERELDPVGTPTGIPPVKRDSKSTPPRAESTMTAEKVSAQPAPTHGAPRPRSQASPAASPKAQISQPGIRQRLDQNAGAGPKKATPQFEKPSPFKNQGKP